MKFMVKCIKVTEYKDGSATYDFEINKETERFITEYYNKKRFSKKLFGDFVREVIKHWFKKFKKEKKNV